jgi:hypothetical protein
MAGALSAIWRWLAGSGARPALAGRLAPSDPTGGYRVYLGEQESAATSIGRARVTLSNIREVDAIRWLVLAVAETASGSPMPPA